MFKSSAVTAALLAAALCMAASGPLRAAVSEAEAQDLGGKLTAFGAEKAGNADGSIPEYTGGLKSVPGYDPKADRYIDPFKDEKPVYTVDAGNMSKYEASLTEGDKAMLKKYPDYKIMVYPSHRTVWYPDWVTDNIKKNATTAKLVGSVEGDGVGGAAPDGFPWQGTPFPIPKNGFEVMWNHKIAPGAAVSHHLNKAFMVDTSGGVTDLPVANEYFVRSWYDQSGALRKQTYDATMGVSSRLQDPPSSAGIVFLNYYTPSTDDGGQKVWFYTPGQRRVRKAPEFAYDTPIASYGGVLQWDELWGFIGRMDRFDMQLVGKKEMIVPYNVFGVTNNLPARGTLGKSFIQPEAVRYEKHRVWVVEAKRKDNARHAYKLRRFYVDEDCWCIVSSESYDDSGKLWKVGKIYSFPSYNTGGVDNATWNFNDVIKGNYFIINIGAGDPGFFNRNYTSAEGLNIPLTPASVAAGSSR
ncbi:MAG: hypothetical protein JWQ90_5261 [Hydrocarboniphaga sp.]|uniref:DUF1329 domain-containing protein n=1 Tax=Hydrocarboniphaga sp. TaxID=2033016 RepID=UPI00262E3F6D|nr:DUF1329 domain-containing protein [Hydrocarboniphaga sp.]MDB5972811.1 hypothetical protein [Hydrocarboniphaga sp.]